MSYAKCLCWPLEHAEQLLFSCLCSKVTNYKWNWHFFQDYSSKYILLKTLKNFEKKMSEIWRSCHSFRGYVLVSWDLLFIFFLCVCSVFVSAFNNQISHFWGCVWILIIKGVMLLRHKFEYKRTRDYPWFIFRISVKRNRMLKLLLFFNPFWTTTTRSNK